MCVLDEMAVCFSGVCVVLEEWCVARVVCRIYFTYKTIILKNHFINHVPFIPSQAVGEVSYHSTGTVAGGVE